MTTTEQTCTDAAAETRTLKKTQIRAMAIPSAHRNQRIKGVIKKYAASLDRNNRWLKPTNKTDGVTDVIVWCVPDTPDDKIAEIASEFRGTGCVVKVEEWRESPSGSGILWPSSFLDPMGR
jgi:hypothetical protein